MEVLHDSAVFPCLNRVEIDWKEARLLADETHQSALIKWLIDAIQTGDREAVIFTEIKLKQQPRLGYLHHPKTIRLLLDIFRDHHD